MSWTVVLMPLVPVGLLLEMVLLVLSSSSWLNKGPRDGGFKLLVDWHRDF
jgi:hypothetical protein